MSDPLQALLDEVRACRQCAHSLPMGPRPVLQAGGTARVRIIGQAPGRKVHASGIPWDDASGERLRGWLGLAPAEFYDAAKVAILPMGFCYPGRASSGDLPPRPECARLWHDRLNTHLPQLRLTLLIGRHAQAHYLRGQCRPNLSETLRAWQDYLPQGFLPLPHPSPRNQPWLAKNAWFIDEVLPVARRAVRAALS